MISLSSMVLFIAFKSGCMLRKLLHVKDALLKDVLLVAKSWINEKTFGRIILNFSPILAQTINNFGFDSHFLKSNLAGLNLEALL